MVRQLVEQVMVYDDHIAIKFKSGIEIEPKIKGILLIKNVLFVFVVVRICHINVLTVV